jgi:hypothetical protein
VISFDTVIRRFGPLAMRIQLMESEETDSMALAALNNKAAPGSDRAEAIRSWLQSYQVFQGIDGPKRIAIAAAVVQFFDARDPHRDLTSVDALVKAHAEMMTACQEANGDKRDFTSLASKALWLCYPSNTPLFDAFAQSALHVISKLEPDISTLPASDSEYYKFAHVWMALYQRYSAAIDAIDIGDYPYHVRIFDKILWLIGEPRYGLQEALGE